MNTIIYWYSGTGNSLWTAKKFAEKLGDTKIIPMATGRAQDEADRIGFIFPVHMWGVPYPVVKFIRGLNKIPRKYYFAAAVNAGEVSRTLIQLNEILKNEGIKLSAGFDVPLESNYIPWGGPGTKEQILGLMKRAESIISEAADYIKAGSSGRIDKGPLWQRIIYTWIYKSAVKYVPMMDKSFWADDKCNGCGICGKICPAENITFKDNRPVWNHKCHQCLACIQWCPQKAIQFGKKTAKYERYHNPEIKLTDLMR